MTSETLFLGKGRVSTSIACFVQGPKRAFEEKAGQIESYRFDDKRKEWEFIEKFPGSFDEIDWNSFSSSKVFVSPGVSSLRPFLEKIKDREVRELDLFCENFSGEIVIVTGTNGKSSLTAQLGAVLQKKFSQQDVFVGGNLEPAAFELFKLEKLPKIAVLEVSSYQAERLKTSHFNLGVLTNLGPDHFDRYSSQKDYHQAKWDLLSRCEQVIYPKEYSFLKNSEVDVEASLSSLQYLQKLSGFLKNRWNIELTPKDLSSLPQLRHRLEEHRLANQALLINDSKATNVHSVVYAVHQLRKKYKKFKWILGGHLKGDCFDDLNSLFTFEDQLFVYGPGREQICSQLSSLDSQVFQFKTLKQTLEELKNSLKPDDTIVLSPGAASFGEFIDYADRGDFFLKFFDS